MTFEFGLHKHAKFHRDPLRFAGVIREKPILRKIIFALSCICTIAYNSDAILYGVSRDIQCVSESAGLMTVLTHTLCPVSYTHLTLPTNREV